MLIDVYRYARIIPFRGVSGSRVVGALIALLGCMRCGVASHIPLQFFRQQACQLGLTAQELDSLQRQERGVHDAIQSMALSLNPKKGVRSSRVKTFFFFSLKTGLPVLRLAVPLTAVCLPSSHSVKIIRCVWYGARPFPFP